MRSITSKPDAGSGLSPRRKDGIQPSPRTNIKISSQTTGSATVTSGRSGETCGKNSHAKFSLFSSSCLSRQTNSEQPQASPNKREQPQAPPNKREQPQAPPNKREQPQAPLSKKDQPQQQLTGLPTIRPPRKTKQQLIPELTVFKEVEESVKRIPRFASGSVENLATRLSLNRGSDLHNVRAIFCWIAYNISYEDTSNSANSRQGIDSVLRTGSAMCLGYSRLLQALCKQASIPCLLIEGIGKGNGHDPETVHTAQSSGDHAWNIVYVKGEWRPLDVTWGAGCLEKGSFKRRFDEHWFLTDPVEFVDHHFPLKNEDGDEDSAKYQLLKRPISVERFSEAIAAKSLAYTMGIKYLTHNRTTIDVQREVTIKIKATRQPLQAVRVTLVERGVKNATKNSSHTLASLSRDGTCTVYVRPPRLATYLLQVMGCSEISEGNSKTLHELFSYVIKCLEVHPNQEPFPDKPGAWGLLLPDARDCGLRHPGNRTSFSFCSKNGLVKIPLPLKQRTQLKVELRHARSMDKDLSRNVFLLMKTKEAVIRARLPTVGYYMLSVFAGQPEQKVLQQVGSFLLFAEKGCEDDKRYPGGSSIYGLLQPVATECGLKEARRASYFLRAKKGRVRVNIPLSRFTELKIKLTHADSNEEDLTEFTFTEFDKGGANVSVQLPKTGYYRLHVFASHPTQTPLKPAADFLIFSSVGCAQCKPYPVVYKLACQERVRLLQPKTGQVPSGTPILFRIKAPSLGKVNVAEKPMERMPGGIWQAEVTLTKSQQPVVMYGSVDSAARTLNGLYQFTVL